MDLANQALSADAASTKKFGDAYTADLQSFKTAMTAYRTSMPAADPQLIDDLQTNWNTYAGIATTKMIPAGRRNALGEWASIRDREVLPVARMSTELSALVSTFRL